MSLPLIDQALYPEHKDVFDIVKISGTGIALIIQLYIAASTYTQLRRSESNISREVVILFVLSLSCAVVHTIIVPVMSTLEMSYHHSYDSHPAIVWAWSLACFLYIMFLYILFITLVVRLYVTFKGTALAMSKCAIYIFVVILVLLFVVVMFIVAGYTLHAFDDAVGWTLFLFSVILALLLYFVGSVLAVRLFVKNLHDAAKLQANTMRCPTRTADDIALNAKQQRLLKLASRYILLFFVALCSTFLAECLMFIVSFECRAVFMTIDLCINLQCLFLQFAFAEKSYQKCCGCLDSRCVAVITNQTKRRIHRESISMMQEMGIASGVPTVTAKSSESKERSGSNHCDVKKL